MRNLLIDFDRVIHAQSQGFKDGEIYDIPTDFAKEAINILKKDYRIVIFTARDKKKFQNIADYLNKNKIYFDEISNIKKGGLIIDDHAVRFTNWRDILNLLTEW